MITISNFIFHELGHAVSANYYKVEVGDIGLGIYLFRPVLYTDLSNCWVLDRKKRVVTNLGGVYFQLVYALVLSAFIPFFNSTTVTASLVLIVISIILNLNPVLRLDGYWILTDALGIININDRAFDFFKQVLKSIFKRKFKFEEKYNIKKSYRIVYYSYLIIYVVSTIVAILFGTYLVIKLFINNAQLVSSFNVLISSINAKDFSSAFHSFNSLGVIVLPAIYFAIMLIYGLSKFFKQLSIKKGK